MSQSTQTTIEGFYQKGFMGKCAEFGVMEKDASTLLDFLRRRAVRSEAKAIKSVVRNAGKTVSGLGGTVTNGIRTAISKALIDAIDGAKLKKEVANAKRGIEDLQKVITNAENKGIRTSDISAHRTFGEKVLDTASKHPKTTAGVALGGGTAIGTGGTYAIMHDKKAESVQKEASIRSSINFAKKLALKPVRGTTAEQILKRKIGPGLFRAKLTPMEKLDKALINATDAAKQKIDERIVDFVNSRFPKK